MSYPQDQHMQPQQQTYAMPPQQMYAAQPAPQMYAAPPQPQVYVAQPQQQTYVVQQQTVEVVPPPQQNTVSVVLAGEQCANCGAVGRIRSTFTCCGIALAIIFFPIGLLCCFLMRETICEKCGGNPNKTGQKVLVAINPATGQPYQQ